MPSISDASAWFEQCREALHQRDLEGHIVRSNRSARRKFGWPETPFDPDDSEATDDARTTARREGQWIGRLTRLDARGDECSVESRWSLIHDDSGDAGGFLVFEFDRVDLRPSDQEMIHAQRMEGIGTLAGGIAHDINNILGPILIAAEMIKRRVEDPWVESKLDAIEHSARRGAEIVKQVLDFSRGVEGEFISLQLRYLLKDVVAFARRTFTKAIEIYSNIPQDLLPIRGDAALLRQMILNIMINARDAMPEGGTLTISAVCRRLSQAEATEHSPHATEGEFVHISVTDTGHGIDPDVIHRIFEPFFTTKTRRQGTGLGLSTSMTIVRSHGGFMVAQSELGLGATFSVYLPAEPEDAGDAELAPKSVPAVESQPGRAQTILVVDDEPLMLEMNIDMLEASGYHTLGAEDGRKGLDIFLGDPAAVDLIVTDINMPVMDGPSMVAEIRKVHPEIPVIAVSGLPEHRHTMEGTGLGDIQILTKPYAMDELLQAIRDQLGPHNLENEHPQGSPGASPDASVVSDNDFRDLLGGEDW